MYARKLRELVKETESGIICVDTEQGKVSNIYYQNYSRPNEIVRVSLRHDINNLYVQIWEAETEKTVPTDTDFVSIVEYWNTSCGIRPQLSFKVPETENLITYRRSDCSCIFHSEGITKIIWNFLQEYSI